MEMVRGERSVREGERSVCGMWIEEEREERENSE